MLKGINQSFVFSAYEAKKNETKKTSKIFLIYFVKFIDNIETMCYLQSTLTKTITHYGENK